MRIDKKRALIVWVILLIFYPILAIGIPLIYVFIRYKRQIQLAVLGFYVAIFVIHYILSLIFIP